MDKTDGPKDVQGSAVCAFWLQNILDVERAGSQYDPIDEFTLIKLRILLVQVVPRTYFSEEIEDRLMLVYYYCVLWVCVHFIHQE